MVPREYLEGIKIIDIKLTPKILICGEIYEAVGCPTGLGEGCYIPGVAKGEDILCELDGEAEYRQRSHGDEQCLISGDVDVTDWHVAIRADCTVPPEETNK